MPTWSVLELLRKNPGEYREMVRRRGMDPGIVDRAVEIDKRYREKLREIEELRAERNRLSRRIARSRGEERKRLIEEVRRLDERQRAAEEELKRLEEERRSIFMALPNILAPDVPDGASEEENVPVRFWGEPRVPRRHLDLFREQTEKWGFKVPHVVVDEEPVPHADMLEKVLRLGDTMQAARVAGSRFYYLYDDLVWLDFAISMYALDYLASKGFRVVIPPYMIRREIIMAAIDFEGFKDMIYKVENENLYLIGTAEHPLLGLAYRNPFHEKDLPVKLAGWSPCFRREAGAGNRDLKGIFRVHQFHKVEQFIFAHPEDSWRYFDELVSNTEELVRGLGLPYRVVNICAGELGAQAAKKYDIEVWFPAQGRYREIASISHTLDWQAFRGNLTYIRARDGRREYLHTLNGTGLPTSRVITAILENYQRSDGYVEVPRVLRKYLEPIKTAPKDYIAPAGERAGGGKSSQ